MAAEPGRAGVVTHLDDRPVEGWTDADGSRLVWRTLMSADRDGPVSMCVGRTTIPVRTGRVTRHRHAPDELYVVISGAGSVVIDGVAHELRAGSCAYVPGNAWHAVENPGPDPIDLIYAFSVGSFSDVVYEFEPGAPAPVWDAVVP